MTARKRKLRKGSAETSTQLQGSPDVPLEPDQLNAAPDTPDTKSTKLSHATNTPEAQERTPQSVHALILEPPTPIESSFPAKVPVQSGHTQAYHDWWQHAQSNTRLFGAHLMGDVQQPSLVSSISLADLAFCRCLPAQLC